MPCRNRGEIIRLMLEEARSSYELEVVGFRAWARDVKATTPDGKLPCLRNYDGRGTDLCQEQAITRFLADKLGLAGSDAAERAAVDAMYCFWFSTLRNNGVSHDGEHYSVAALKEADEGLSATSVPPSSEPITPTTTTPPSSTPSTAVPSSASTRTFTVAGPTKRSPSIGTTTGDPVSTSASPRSWRTQQVLQHVLQQVLRQVLLQVLLLQEGALTTLLMTCSLNSGR